MASLVRIAAAVAPLLALSSALNATFYDIDNCGKGNNTADFEYIVVDTRDVWAPVSWKATSRLLERCCVTHAD